MNARKTRWVAGVAVVAVVVGLPLAGYIIRRHGEPGCALDGAKINQDYRVEVVASDGRTHAFCCLRCAEIWLGRQSTPPRTVLVTDEASGNLIDARDAFYVRSSVVTTPATANRVHAFLSRADAEKHADKHGGTVLSGSEKPFP
jgi:hypothetical protein